MATKKMHLEPERQQVIIRFGRVKARGKKVQSSLDRLFGKAPDGYGHWFAGAYVKKREAGC